MRSQQKQNKPCVWIHSNEQLSKTQISKKLLLIKMYGLAKLQFKDKLMTLESVTGNRFK